MNSITCVVHNGEFDDADAVELPNGWCCIPCYIWLEELLTDDEEDELEEGSSVVVFTFEEGDDD